MKKDAKNYLIKFLNKFDIENINITCFDKSKQSNKKACFFFKTEFNHSKEFAKFSGFVFETNNRNFLINAEISQCKISDNDFLDKIDTSKKHHKSLIKFNDKNNKINSIRKNRSSLSKNDIRLLKKTAKPIECII
jgi:hypothetical protein